MKVKTRLLIHAGVIAFIVAVAFATSIVGLNFGTILSSGTVNTEVGQQLRVALPVTTGEEQERQSLDRQAFHQRSLELYRAGCLPAPNGHTGWHSHPGILPVSVMEGSIEWATPIANVPSTMWGIP